MSNLYKQGYPYCQGECTDVGNFKSAALEPLAEQTDHDKFWATYNKMQESGIVKEGPTASCIGYDYTEVSLLYTIGDTSHQEYLTHPTKCACV